MDSHKFAAPGRCGHEAGLGRWVSRARRPRSSMASWSPARSRVDAFKKIVEAELKGGGKAKAKAN